LAEELHAKLTAEHTMLYHQPWPEFDAEALIENEIELVVQVNGKLRDRIRLAPDATEEVALQTALASPKIQEYTNDKTMRKVIYVQGRLLNLVVG
jgi:leucyl-tRNA synthetase